ncbi:MAG: succinate dehydrogenase assembly factor 2 [Yoonia sp.]|uniref:succinate dehydrogenase assembly factor 2 n=1 Tax=Yoonia sp. TaxID=2212373 RepID=UPI00273ED143|nr:succinate dehydrogenase assembly factor 2 [Yoonia sp.]MDP5086906.1 succinate dehydrogenase assembly factor 2 [Yoonia sp.]MDP5362718.1 succinate dehydrogenase assembly factor 2 [Paracoccaceae bacterium]
MTETRDTMIKRLRMRSMRRGIKEMDLILSAFAAEQLTGFTDEALELYDRLLTENDHDIYGWIGGQLPVPEAYLDLVTQISASAHGVTRPA